MSVQDIELAIRGLSQAELTQLTEWFDEFRADLWDKQIERDVRAGKLDTLIREAEQEFSAGNCRPL
jgi:hypothetical protein